MEADTELKSFKSIDDDLNDFLLNDAKNYAEELLAVTYLMIDAETDDIIAYYSLLNDQIRFTEDDKPVRNRINRSIPFTKQRTHYPAVKIGRLAVAEAYAHQGIGQAILESIKYKFTHGNRTQDVGSSPWMHTPTPLVSMRSAVSDCLLTQTPEKKPD